MNILFISSSLEDYLADSLLHGFKSFSNINVTDYPKVDIIYKIYKGKHSIRGNGFTLYNLVEDNWVDRYNIVEKINLKKYELVIFSSIHRQFGVFLQLYPFLDRKKTLIVDGEDSPAIFPYQGCYWRKPYLWFLPRVHKKFVYYKREWTLETLRYRWYKLVPHFLTKLLPVPKNLKKISFSIPKEKIVLKLPKKTKLFPKHIVDPEISNHVKGSNSKYVFENEGEYYKDIQTAKFGITTKRSGWDCLRHYEIAANGSVPCFKDLNKKPITCAPHGLNTLNCISYSNYTDLIEQIEKLSETDYRKLQTGAWDWAKRNTTIERVIELLKDFNYANFV